MTGAHLWACNLSSHLDFPCDYPGSRQPRPSAMMKASSILLMGTAPCWQPHYFHADTVFFLEWKIFADKLKHVRHSCPFECENSQLWKHASLLSFSLLCLLPVLWRSLPPSLFFFSFPSPFMYLFGCILIPWYKTTSSVKCPLVAAS